MHCCELLSIYVAVYILPSALQSLLFGLVKFSWNPIYFMIRRVTSCLLSTSMHTVSHNRPLVPSGEQVQRVEELSIPAVTGVVGVGMVYTSVHLFFTLLFFSFILWLTSRERQCQVWTCQGHSYSEIQILAVVSTFLCASYSAHTHNRHSLPQGRLAECLSF